MIQGVEVLIDAKKHIPAVSPPAARGTAARLKFLAEERHATPASRPAANMKSELVSKPHGAAATGHAQRRFP